MIHTYELSDGVCVGGVRAHPRALRVVDEAVRVQHGRCLTCQCMSGDVGTAFTVCVKHWESA